MLRSATPRRRARALLGAALALGAAVTAVAARPLALVDGVQFSYRVSSSAAGQKGAPPASYVSSVRLAGGNMRMDYTEGVNPMAGQGGYMVIRGEDERIAIVNPKERAVMILDAAALGSGMGAMLNNPMLRLTFKDQSFSYEDLGAGETILGNPTRRFRLRQKYTLEMRVMGMRRSSTDETVTEQWIATELKGVDERAMKRWARAFGSGVKVTNPELAAQMDRFLRDSKGGIALRSVMVATHDDGKRTQVDTTRMEVVDLKPGSFDASIFGWPDDYTVTDLGQVFAGVADSMRAARPDSTPGVKEQAKDAAVKEGVKAGIRGILGRKKP